MKAAARTYHPVPSLQRDEMSRKEIQDAPRIKATLKHCFLDWEVAAPPTCLRDIAVKLVCSRVSSIGSYKLISHTHRHHRSSHVGPPQPLSERCFTYSTKRQ